MKLSEIIKLMRPHQYVKNIFIFLPIFFALQITNMDFLFQAFIAFVAFSLTASAIYILNDYFDIEEDRQHPKKKYRPLASGTISKKNGIMLMVFLSLAGALLMISVSLEAFIYFASLHCDEYCL